MLARDAGGNERHALACLDASRGSELPLTHDPDAIHQPGALAPDGATLAFTHTERNGVDFDLALVGLDGRAGASSHSSEARAAPATGRIAGSSCGA